MVNANYLKVYLDIIEQKKRQFLSIQVKDNGRGISKEKLKNIGSITSEVNSGTAGEKGYSLGLRLVKEMVESRNGTLQIDSKPGVGTSSEVKITIREVS